MTPWLLRLGLTTPRTSPAARTSSHSVTARRRQKTAGAGKSSFSRADILAPPRRLRLCRPTDRAGARVVAQACAAGQAPAPCRFALAPARLAAYHFPHGPAPPLRAGPLAALPRLPRLSGVSRQAPSRARCVATEPPRRAVPPAPSRTSPKNSLRAV